MQRGVVTHGRGPLLVIAGPESGKTFVLTQHVCFLTEECGVVPQSVLVLIFSCATTREMEERYRKLCDKERTGISFGTFHALLFHTLRTTYDYQTDQVIGEEEQRALVFAVLRHKKTESDDFRSLVQNVLSEVALAREEKAELPYYYSTSCLTEQFREVYRAYEHGFAELRKIDYEDMLRMCYGLLKEQVNVCEALSERYAWILADEFQDINRLQYGVVCMFAGKWENLMIIGNDDQPIYRFHGAAPEVMPHFERGYPEASKVVLSVNYRSTPEIVKTAGRLIQRDKTRFSKEITTACPSGKPVNTVICPTPHVGADCLIREIRELVCDGVRYDSITVLYRTSLQPCFLAWHLYQENIPFRMQEMLPDLSEYQVIRDLLTYLRLARSRVEPGNLLCVMNRPNHYICRETMRMEGESLTGLRCYYEKNGERWMDERLGKFAGEFQRLGYIHPSEAIVYIRTKIGYDNSLKQYAEERRIEAEGLSDILKEIEASAGGFPTVSAWQAGGTVFSAACKARSKQTEAGDEMQLTTYHTSKGFESPTVFLLGVNEGIMPYRKADSREEPEEERYVPYVAMTRAKDELRILTRKTRFHRKAEGGRFVREYESH